jgi:hypothetical protein
VAGAPTRATGLGNPQRRDHVQQREGPVPSRIGGQVDDHGVVLVTAAGVPPQVLINP